jgi:bifunctional DNase/RNase
MKKIRLDIVGLSYSQTQTGAYALVLGESGGKRRLPIIIGGFEAQAIAIELEKMTPSRPLTHDLFKSFAQVFDIEITEVIIYNLVEGIFFAKIICSNGVSENEIDARTSDAIALAVRFNCPISTYDFILSSSGILLEDDSQGLPSSEQEDVIETQINSLIEDAEGEYSAKSTEELKTMLQNALENEQYEAASKIRDEINSRKKS